MAIEFFIPMTVKPKQGGQHGGKRRWQPSKIANNAQDIALLAAPYLPDKPLEGPVRIQYAFQFPWRKSDNTATRALPWIYKDTKPDYTRLAAQLDDVLEGLGFFTNDSQIAEAHIRKTFADSPGVYVMIEQIEAAP